MNKNFKVKSKIWRWPGDAGWHFVTLDKDLSTKIRSEYSKGFVKIEASLGKSIWQTSLFPHKKAGYLLCINKSIRKKEDVILGDEVTISIKIK